MTRHLSRRDALKVLGFDLLAAPAGCLLATAAPPTSWWCSRAAAAEGDAAQVSDADRQTADEIERVMWQQVLRPWYPRCQDAAGGGFHENFAEDWSAKPTTSKFIVFQSRMTWTAAAVARRYPKHREEYLSYVRHGLKFLTERMWDAQHGGFFNQVDDAGQPVPGQLHVKQMYGEAFGIYGAAEAHAATGDRAALDLAVKAFRWIEQTAHDPQCGGYFEHLTRDGRPLTPEMLAKEAAPDFGPIGVVGQKSMNAHIHILEALTSLARVWDDPLLKGRLAEVFEIVRDKIVRPEGHLAMFASRDFQPVDERNSFGHQLETAFLLLEADEMLGRHEAKTREVARRLVDQSIRFGWDAQMGGFFDEGPPAAPATRREKIWWVQPEAMNGLLTVDRMLGGNPPRYRELFDRTWAFFRDHIIDRRHGGFYEAVDEQARTIPGKLDKATRWQETYHVVRAMLYAIDELRHPA